MCVFLQSSQGNKNEGGIHFYSFFFLSVFVESHYVQRPEIDVPPYDTRRQLTVRDPWAVVLSFQTVVRCIFAKLLGIRMCFRCPACDCRDARGHGCHVTGGILGIVTGLCGAIEYQANSTPHFHCNVYIASIWQQSLSELAAKLNDSTITFEDVQQFLTWAHSESHPDLASHTQQQDHLEADWAQNNCKASHDFLCQWPNSLPKTKRPVHG